MQFAIGAASIMRTPRQIAHSRGEDLMLQCQIASGCQFEQNDRRIMMTPGDMTLIDPMRPYRCHYRPQAQHLVLKIPRDLLEARIGPIKDTAGKMIKAEPGASGLLSSWLMALPENVPP